MNIDDRVDELIYLIQCPHQASLCLEEGDWCGDCDDWIEGVEVGDLSVVWQKDGEIVVSGGGYVSRPEA